MPIPTITASQAKAARTAGILYFLVALIAPIGLMYVPGKIFVSGDAAATAERIRSSEWLLRLGIGAEVIPQVIAIFVVLALYRLFKPVDKNQAVLMVILGGLISIPIMFISVLNEIAALILVNDANFLTVFSRSQLDALAYLFLRLHGQGLVIAWVPHRLRWVLISFLLLPSRSKSRFKAGRFRHQCADKKHARGGPPFRWVPVMHT